MKLKHHIFCFFLILVQYTVGQDWTSFELNEDLQEISGLEILNDSTLVAINDGGNGPLLFLLDKVGSIRSRVKVGSAKNIDWEDLTRDDDFLYIADFGNNNDKRKDLTIYKVLIADVLENNEVIPEIISFNYKAAGEDELNDGGKLFDAEALAFYNDSLWIISKPNPKVWDGKASLYKLSCEPGNYILEEKAKLFSGPDSWVSDAITAADFYNDELYVITYNRIIKFKFAELDFFQTDVWGYQNPSQMESIVIKADGEIILANEKNRLLGGGNLYYLRTNVDQH